MTILSLFEIVKSKRFECCHRLLMCQRLNDFACFLAYLDESIPLFLSWFEFGLIVYFLFLSGLFWDSGPFPFHVVVSKVC